MTLRSTGIQLIPADLGRIADLDGLLAYLRDNLDWPYDAPLDDVTFDESAESLGLDSRVPLPRTIRQLRLPARNVPGVCLCWSSTTWRFHGRP